VWFPEVDNKPISKTSRRSIEVSSSNSSGDIDSLKQRWRHYSAYSAASGFPLFWIEPFINFYLRTKFQVYCSISLRDMEKIEMANCAKMKCRKTVVSLVTSTCRVM